MSDITSFKELCAAMVANDQRIRDFRDKSRSLAHQFARAIQEYIGAPQEWAKEVHDRQTKEEYVSARPVREDWSNFPDGGNPFADMTFSKENFFLFKVSIVLEHGPNSYPKQAYYICCGVKPLRDGVCKLFIGAPGTRDHKPFECHPSANDINVMSFEDPVEYAVSVLRGWLAYDPFTSEG